MVAKFLNLSVYIIESGQFLPILSACMLKVAISERQLPILSGDESTPHPGFKNRHPGFTDKNGFRGRWSDLQRQPSIKEKLHFQDGFTIYYVLAVGPEKLVSFQ